MESGREPLVIEDLASHPLTCQLAFTKQLGNGCMVGVPILLRAGRMYGTLCAIDKKPFRITKEMLNLMEAMSTLIASVIDLEDDTLKHTATEILLEENQKMYQTLFDNNPDAVFSVNVEGCFTSMNASSERLSGYRAKELLGSSFWTLVAPDSSGDVLHHFEDSLRGHVQNFTMKMVHRNGHEITLDLKTIPIETGGQLVGIFGIAKDITDKKRYEEIMEHMAFHDALTGLPNRNLFMNRTTSVLAKRKHSQQLAMLFLDLDNFKTINDTLGHALGDELLKKVSNLLESCVRSRDLVCRFGGDEFTILFPRIKTMIELEKVVRRIKDLFMSPIAIDGHSLYITVSIGIAIAPDHGVDVDSLMKHADTAMYFAKTQGKNTYRYYDDLLNRSLTKRFQLESELRLALEREEFTLHYQPQVNVQTRCISGFEALVRWHHPVRGLLYPTEFIRVAEETGLICSLGYYVLTTACKQAKKWHDQGYSLLLSVNISMPQLEHANFLADLQSILQATLLPPRFLELEITESMLMKDVDKATTLLQTLQKLGISIAIDDFGTGYSSLSYLKKFSIDTLKIDQSFISDIGENADGEAITLAIVAMARSLNMRVIAEGVETTLESEYLIANQCFEMQGYLYGKPQTAELCDRHLKELGLSFPFSINHTAPSVFIDR